MPSSRGSRESLELQFAGKLALGTAQFGLSYGVSNTRGRVSSREAAAILKEAMSSGVRTIDTAEGYAESEAVIGTAIAGLPCAFDMVTKFPGGTSGRLLPVHLARSLDRLQVRSLAGYLAHDPASLLDSRVVHALTEARETGLIERFGASVYYPHELEKYFERDIDVGLVQIPYSVVDQRFAPLLPELRSRGVHVHARSVFLQGLLLMDPGRLPKGLEGASSTIAALREEAAARDVPLHALLLGVALHQEAIDRVVVGVTSLEEFRMNISVLGPAAECRLPADRALSFAIVDEAVLIPSNWVRSTDGSL